MTVNVTVIASAGLLSYPCFLALDTALNVIVANSGCGTLVVLDKETGHVLAAANVEHACGVCATDAHELLVSSSSKHVLSVY